MTPIKKLLRRTEGSSAVEFAIAAPVLLGMIFGLIKLGIMFMANAGLQHAVDEGARIATVHSQLTTEEMSAAIRKKATSSRFGLDPARVDAPTINYGVDNGADFAEVTMTYRMPVDFVFFRAPDVTLTRKRRAYLPR